MMLADDYLRRCAALHDRGLSLRLCTDLASAGNASTLFALEAASDAELVAMSEAARRRDATAAQLGTHLWVNLADLAGRSEADVERTCNGPLLWEGDYS